PLNTALPDHSWIADYVREVLDQSLAGIDLPSMGAMTETSGRKGLQIFETHRSVFVRVAVPKHIHVDDLRIFASPTRIRIAGLRRKGPLSSVLPVAVNPAKAYAALKSRTLEIRLPKSRKGGREREIFLRHL